MTYVVHGTRHDILAFLVEWHGDDWKECGQAIQRAKEAGCEIVTIRFTDSPKLGPGPTRQDYQNNEDYCIIHGVKMNYHKNERGGWYSHIDQKTDEWCKGKEKKTDQRVIAGGY